jgi:hypothetical protein
MRNWWIRLNPAVKIYLGICAAFAVWILAGHITIQ